MILGQITSMYLLASYNQLDSRLKSCGCKNSNFGKKTNGISLPINDVGKSEKSKTLHSVSEMCLVYIVPSRKVKAVKIRRSLTF